ncbi:MAG: right-handed parallel beta-helix repeat-containing protein [Myxococcota bacterium]
MALVNMLAAAGSAASDPNADFSALLDTVLGDDVAYFPVREIEGVVVPYRLYETIDLDGRGARVICDDQAVLRGVLGQPIFVSNRANRRTRISGGRWEQGSALLRHEAAPTLQLLRVHGVTAVGFDAAFDFVGDAIACAWRDCTFEACGSGLRFSGLANIHTVDRCRFTDGGDGISLLLRLDNRLQFAVTQSAFVGNERGVVVDGAGQQGLSVRNCRFEDQAAYDIYMALSGVGAWIDSVSIEDCVFAQPSSTQEARIFAYEQVSFRATDCQAEVAPPSLVFARVHNSATKYKTWLERNRLRISTASTCDEALLHKTGAGCLTTSEPLHC